MIKNTTKRKVLARRHVTYKSIFSQGLGLMFKKKSKSALFIFYIENIKYIHTFFMRYSIDIIFLNKNMVVTKIERNIRPWNMGIKGKAKYIIELPAGRALNTQKGDKISFK